MKFIILASALVFSTSCFTPTAVAESAECCKTCTKGKACGDTCIEKADECHVPSGCACNGRSATCSESEE